MWSKSPQITTGATVACTVWAKHRSDCMDTVGWWRPTESWSQLSGWPGNIYKMHQKHEDVQSEESFSPPPPDIHQEGEEEKVCLHLSQLLGHLIIFNISYFDL